MPRPPVLNRLTALALACTLTASPLLAQPPVHVEIIRPVLMPQTHQVRFIGTISAPETYPASFRSSGRITALKVDTGDEIAQGSIIAELDQTTAQSALDAARASVTAAKAQLDQSAQARKRAEGLLERGSGTQDALDQAMQDYLQDKASLDSAEAQLESAQQDMEDTVLRAIDDAVVTERAAEIDEVVSAGQEVVMLANQRAREAVFQAPDIAGLADLTGRKVTLALGGTDQSPTATITEVSPQLSDTGTVTIKARLDPTDPPPQIGALVTGALDLPQPEWLSLPWEALVRGADGSSAIWVVDPQTAQVRLLPVTVTAYGTRGIELTPSADLNAETQVVGKGAEGLFDGQKVTDGAQP